MTNIFHRDAVDAAGAVRGANVHTCAAYGRTDGKCGDCGQEMWTPSVGLALHIVPRAGGGGAVDMFIEGDLNSSSFMDDYCVAVDYAIAWLREQRERIGEKR